MSRCAILRETLYYGSDRQQQYWENEAQTLRIARESHSAVWKAYNKENGIYVPVLVQHPQMRRRHKKTELLALIGYSAEEVIALLQRDHRRQIILEQRLRRWINKTSGERILVFLDPNLGGAPVITPPPQWCLRSPKKVSYA